MRALACLLALAACDDPYNGRLTPEKAAGAPDGHLVVVVGEVFATSFDTVEVAMHRQERLRHIADPTWSAEREAESEMGERDSARAIPYDDTENYHRTPDHYVLVRSKVPNDVVLGDPDFTPGALLDGWGLGAHLTDIDPAMPMPEIGSTVMITGKINHVVWNSREIKVPIVEDPQIVVMDGPSPLGGPGDTCARDQECNARLLCDRTSLTCVPPPREIYWDDPFRDINGACDSDADCPLGQVCDASYVMAATGTYAPQHLATQDIGRHVCTLAPGETLATQCPRIYTARDIAGARFVSGKEICVRGTLLTNLAPSDGDTHDQLTVDEPIPYPAPDIAYNLFGAVTENGPMYKDPALPGGAVTDPAIGQDVVAVGTYRYDMGHGWYEVHPVKRFFAPPP